MAIYALIADGTVCQNGAAPFDVAPPMAWVDVTALTPTPQPGWTATNAAGVWTFAAPPVPPPPPIPTTMSPLVFMTRFTNAEQTAIATAAMSNVNLWLWFTRLSAATSIDLTNPETVSGIAALVSAGLISADRQTAILTPP